MARKVGTDRRNGVNRKSGQPATHAATGGGDMLKQPLTGEEVRSRLYEIAGELGTCRDEMRITELKKERAQLEARISPRGKPLQVQA